MRAVHSTYVQQGVLQYLHPSNTQLLVGVAIPPSLPKEDRGLGSNLTARFLIPRQHLDAFEKDPDRWDPVRSKTHYSSSTIQHHRAL